jgi:uncharacterized coiled-coil protein SlyX
MTCKVAGYVKELISLKVTRGRILRLANISRATYFRIKADDHCLAEGRRDNTTRLEKRRKLVVKLAETIKKKKNATWPAYPSAESIRKEVNKRLNASLSLSTIQRDLAACDLRSYVRPKKPTLDNDENREAFARKYKNTNWRKWVFSDEHFVSIGCNGCRTQFATDPSKVCPRENKARRNIPNFMVWAAFGFGWRSELIIFPRVCKDEDGKTKGWRMNGESYKTRCLHKVAGHLSSKKLIFQQDGARAHWAERNTRYLEGKGITLVHDWPASSPDLSPIENLWKILNWEIWTNHQPQTLDELKVAAAEAWKNIPKAKLHSLLRSFPRRLKRLLGEEVEEDTSDEDDEDE